jgi:hypothetical protein
MNELLSPELALVDPELAARARAALPDPATRHKPTYRQVGSPAPSAPTHAPAREVSHRPYPLWARVTAALWLLVIGILIGGAAIPHAQDMPRVVPQVEDAGTVCEPPVTPQPTIPGIGSPFRPGP